eukprot:COSAG01_NODE_3693_length_5788_cov_7.398137_2_plen_345_part_00
MLFVIGALLAGLWWQAGSRETVAKEARSQVSSAAQAWVAKANEALRSGELIQAHAALQQAMAAEDFHAIAPLTQMVVRFNLGRLLGFDLPEDLRSTEAASQHLGEAIKLQPDNWQIQSLLADLKLRAFQSGGRRDIAMLMEAQTAINAAVDVLMSDESADRNHVLQTAVLAHEVEITVVHAMRQSTNPAGKAAAREAWQRVAKLGMQFDTAVNKGVQQWSRIASTHKRKPVHGRTKRRSKCPATSITSWDLTPWKKRRSCQRLERYQNVSLDELVSSIDHTQPLIISGEYWPEFIGKAKLDSLLSESAKAQSIVEVAVVMQDGYVVEVQPLGAQIHPHSILIDR